MAIFIAVREWFIEEGFWQLMKRVLFLCTGNYYRSRFAEIFFNWHATRQNLPWQADSRGLALCSLNLGPMSQDTIRHLAGLEIPVTAYLREPRDLTVGDLADADHVVAVKATEHRPLVSKRFSDWLDKIEYWEVHDIDCAVPEEALPHLEKEVLGLIERMKSDRS